VRQIHWNGLPQNDAPSRVQLLQSLHLLVLRQILNLVHESELEIRVLGVLAAVSFNHLKFILDLVKLIIGVFMIQM